MLIFPYKKSKQRLSMKKMFIFAAFLSLLAYSQQSCTADKTPVLVLADTCIVQGMTYQRLQPLLKRTCSDGGCHNSGFAPNVLDYDAFKSYALNNGLFHNRVLVQENMPTVGIGRDLTQAEKDSLNCWHLAGYPEN